MGLVGRPLITTEADKMTEPKLEVSQPHVSLKNVVVTIVEKPSIGSKSTPVL